MLLSSLEPDARRAGVAVVLEGRVERRLSRWAERPTSL